MANSRKKSPSVKKVKSSKKKVANKKEEKEMEIWTPDVKITATDVVLKIKAKVPAEELILNLASELFGTRTFELYGGKYNIELVGFREQPDFEMLYERKEKVGKFRKHITLNEEFKEYAAIMKETADNIGAFVNLAVGAMAAINQGEPQQFGTSEMKELLRAILADEAQKDITKKLLKEVWSYTH
ncbi:MAG: hypothetical protein B6I31_03815 [Desulfobacteraceae bacterium 4572_19]|nr:MAG: hypothetical protein B6I31_03815 [Desulfobacteraceae bacterium 4572_19]